MFNLMCVKKSLFEAQLNQSTTSNSLPTSNKADRKTKDYKLLSWECMYRYTTSTVNYKSFKFASKLKIVSFVDAIWHLKKKPIIFYRRIYLFVIIDIYGRHSHVISNNLIY